MASAIIQASKQLGACIIAKAINGDIMNSLSDVLAHNMSKEINKGISDVKEYGFMVLSISDDELIVKSRIHPWRNNHKGLQMQETAITNLQSKIGGEFSKSVFGESELRFDISGIKSVRCRFNPSVFAFNEWVEIVTTNDNDTIIVPIELVDTFRNEFPTLKFRGVKNKWEFVEYTGEYPALCCGDTILTSGDTIIKTKIIQHKCTEWGIEIPSLLKNVEIPSEVLNWDGKRTHCCGGCE